MKGSIAQRIEAKVVRLPFCGCWIFDGSLDTSGYGLIGVGGSGNIGKAHRENFKIYRGPIPEGLQVLRECDTRCCVNPYHLFVGTIQDNMDDRNNKGRQARLAGGAHNMRKLTDEQVLEIRSLYAAGGISMRALANRFGVTRFPIQRIVNNTGWKHI